MVATERAEGGRAVEVMTVGVMVTVVRGTEATEEEVTERAVEEKVAIVAVVMEVGERASRRCTMSRCHRS